MATLGIFLVYFRSFSNKQYKFYNKLMRKCPSSIRCQDSNSQPPDYKSPPLTTRPGLTPDIGFFMTRQNNIFKTTSLMHRMNCCNLFSSKVPKGVMLTHRNLVATLTSIIIGIGLHGNKSDAYLAYLPLAHVLELLCELLMCMNGIKVSIEINYCQQGSGQISIDESWLFKFIVQTQQGYLNLAVVAVFTHLVPKKIQKGIEWNMILIWFIVM